MVVVRGSLGHLIFPSCKNPGGMSSWESLPPHGAWGLLAVQREGPPPPVPAAIFAVDMMCPVNTAQVC